MKKATIKYSVVNLQTQEVTNKFFNSVGEFREQLKNDLDCNVFNGGIIKDIKQAYGNRYALTDLFINGVRII